MAVACNCEHGSGPATSFTDGVFSFSTCYAQANGARLTKSMFADTLRSLPVRSHVIASNQRWS